MNIKEVSKKIWAYLKKDTWDAWLVSLVLTFLFIKFILFPVLSLAFGTALPIVIIESCSMYHSTSFNQWWENNGLWYEDIDIMKEEFATYPFRNGLNKGDVVLVSGYGEYEKGDVIIFNGGYGNPIIHRLIETEPYETKGDNNFGQLESEQNIPEEQVIGKAIGRVPYLGWIKLIFFEGLRAPEDRGFC